MRKFLFFTCLVLISGCRSKMIHERMPPQSAVTEERGIWLNRSEIFGPREELINLLDDLLDAHFTSVYVNTYFRGSVIYPDSAYLPLWSEASDPDVLKWLIPEIKKRGMRAVAWVEYGFYAYHVPDATKTSDRGVFLNMYPELTAISADGKPYLHNEKWGDFYSLCPANPMSQKLIGDLFVEILEKYPFDGINLDRIRFPNEHFCFCEYCRNHFKEDTGIVLEPFEKGTKECEAFVNWRKEQLNRFMETYAPRLHNAREGVTVSLAALPPDMMDTHAQAWDVWMKDGYIDAAMPMLYGQGGFEDRVQNIKSFSNWSMVFCGLDAHGLPPEAVLDQIQCLKQQGARGCVLWYSGQVADDLPGLKQGPFSMPAVSPLEFP